MNATIQFTCPHCQRQMNFPAAAAGQQGKCGGCQQIVMIQPNSQSAGPAVPPALPSSASAITPPTLPPAIIVAQDQEGSRGDTDFAMIQGGGSTALTRTQLSPDAKKKIIILVAAGGGGLAFFGFVLLVVVLLFALGDGVDQSSPEALGRSLFTVVKSDDMDTFITMLPDAVELETVMNAAINSSELSERQLEQAKKGIRDVNFSKLASQAKNEGIDLFNVLADYRDLQDASIVTVVSDGQEHLEELTKMAYTFVVFELGTELHVLVMPDSVRMNDVWYMNLETRPRMSPLRDMRSSANRVLRDALQRTKDSNRNRILDEMAS